MMGVFIASVAEELLDLLLLLSPSFDLIQGRRIQQLRVQYHIIGVIIIVEIIILIGIEHSGLNFNRR